MREFTGLILGLWLIGSSWAQGQEIKLSPVAQADPDFDGPLAELAAEEGEAESVTTTQPAEPEPKAAGPMRGPKYTPMRYDDDFSYLDGAAGSYKEDFFDPIKWIHLTDDLTLTLGGDIRGRMEAVTHKRWGGESPAQDTVFLHRYYTYTDVRYRKLARFFLQSVNAWVEDRDRTPLPNPEDRFDIQQMFIDVRFLGEEVPLALRVGRQELLYGKQRLVSPLGWANVQRSWDGVKVFWRNDDWNVDAWWVRPVQKRRGDVDNVNWDRDFYGLYTTLRVPSSGLLPALRLCDLHGEL